MKPSLPLPNSVIFLILREMLSAKQKITLQRIIPYTLTWLVGAIIYVLLEKGVLADSVYYPSTELRYSFNNVLVIVIPFSVLGGTLMGVLEVLVVKPVFQKFPFGSKLLIKAGVYVLMMMFLLFTVSFTNNSINLGKNFWAPQVVEAVVIFFKSFAFWSVIIYGIFVTIFIQFYTEIADSQGIHQLKNFFLGTYHKPKEEERIFMFLDLKGSTTMAEELGHGKYFTLLQEFFADISDPITESWGEIYQYVGDEVVVSWPKDLGLNSGNCLKCFFKCQDMIKINADRYLTAFGVVPKFKAGIHLGKVAIGEIGVAKREILFSGDVLNTTSRIQSKCNELDVDLLVSSDLYQEIDAEDKIYQVEEIGECQLRGKNETIKLLNLSRS